VDLEKLTEFVDQQRWLLNNGLIPDSVKNQLFMLGSIIHPEVQAVELEIRAEEKCVNYNIYFTKKTLKKIELYTKLVSSTSRTWLENWRLMRFLKKVQSGKEDSLNLYHKLTASVKDFCGPYWSIKLTMTDFDTYINNLDIRGPQEILGVESEPDRSSQQTNQLPD
jgi:hypothetical protein